jgi:ribosomal-protein-alanine N-acetyltransferase
VRSSSWSRSGTASRNRSLPEPVPFPASGLSDGVITLRPPGEADVPAIVAACQDPQIPRYTRVPSPYTDDDGRAFIGRGEDLRRSGIGLSLLVFDREDSLLGSIGLTSIDGENRRAEIGYWVAAPARGQGVATRAVRLLSHWAFETLALERLTIHTDPENEASRAVAEAAGFIPEGVLHGWLNVKGIQRDALVHRLLRSEAT